LVKKNAELQLEIDDYKEQNPGITDVEISDDFKQSELIANFEEVKAEKIEVLELIDKVEQNCIRQTLENEIDEIQNNITTNNKTLKTCSQTINSLKLKERLSPIEKGQLTKKQNQKETVENELKTLKNDFTLKTSKLNSLKTPLRDKFSNDYQDFSKYVSRLLFSLLETSLPKVIFWNYSEEFVLQSETEFKELLNKESLDEISRPMTNIFRIGLETDSLSDIHDIIKTIQTDASERSRQQDIFNQNINRYIKGVWENYDQKLKISFEEHKIRIQFYDPDTKERVALTCKKEVRVLKHLFHFF